MAEDVIWSGHRLLGHRKRQGLTHKDLAEKMLLSPDSIRNYEKERTIPSVQRWGLLANALGLDFRDLQRRFSAPKDDFIDALKFGPRDWNDAELRPLGM